MYSLDISILLFIAPISILIAFPIKPKNLVYTYIILWLFFPHGMRSIGGYYRLDTSFFSYYFILKSIIAISIALRVAINLKLLLADRHTKQLAYWAFIFCLCICILGYIRLSFGYTEQCSINFDLGEAGIYFILDSFFNVIFLLGLITYLRDYQDIEKVFYLFVFAGVLTIADFTFLYKLNSIGSVTHVVQGVDIGGRYRGIIMNDYVRMGRFCILTIGAGLYFWLTKKNLIWLLLAIVMAFIVFHTYQRTAMIMAIIIFAFPVVYLIKIHASRLNMFLVCSLFILVIVSLTTLVVFIPMPDLYIGARQENLLDPRSSYERLFLWLNGFQLFKKNILLGVGLGESQYCLIELLISSGLNWAIFDTSIIHYQTHYVAKSVHNMYLQLMVETGLVGTFLLAWWVFLFKRVWTKIKKGVLHSPTRNKVEIVTTISFAILIANAFGYFFDSHYNWFVFMLSTYLPFLAYRTIPLQK